MTKTNDINADLNHYNAFCASMMTGCAVLEIDSGLRFRQSAPGRGYVVDGNWPIIARSQQAWRNPFTPGMLSGAVITAKLDGRKVHPGQIRNRRVWYRYTRKNDQYGKVRTFLYLAADSDKPAFVGDRRVTITSSHGCGLRLEAAMKRKMDALYWQARQDWEQVCADSRLSRDEFPQPHNNYTDPGQFEQSLGDLLSEAAS